MRRKGKLTHGPENEQLAGLAVSCSKFTEKLAVLNMVFFDTTSINFHGEGGEKPGQRGHSKDKRSDLKQMVVGAVIDQDGRPVCCEMLPGIKYILGARLRKSKEVREEVLTRGGRYREVHVPVITSLDN